MYTSDEMIFKRDVFQLITTFVIGLLFAGLLVASATAAPTTGAATDVGSNNATVFMSGAATTCWFQWGLQAGSAMTWKTPNQTPNGGLCNYTIRGSPIFGSHLWYYRACDVTGCGADGTFTTTAVTVLPTSTYGEIFQNLTENNFDVTFIGMWTVAPYAWVIPTFPGLIWGLILTGLLIGLWLRGRDLGYVAIFGFIIAVAFFGGAYGLGVDVDPVLVGFGQGILYAAIAGAVLSIIKK